MGNINIQSILESAHAAVLNDRLWETWAFDAARKLGGSGIVFGIHDERTKSLERVVALDGLPHAIDDYLGGYHEIDPQVGIVAETAGTNVYVGMPNIDVERKGVLDYLKWQGDIAGIRHHQTAVLQLGESPFRASVCIHKSAELGPVSRDEHRALCQLAPQLERAMQIAFQHSEMLQNAFWNGLTVGGPDQIALLLDERGRVIRHTDAAGRMLARRDGIDLIDRNLTLLKAGQATALRQIIDNATQPVVALSDAMRISRPSGRPPFIVVCHPLQRMVRMLAPLEAAALVTFFDPTSRPASPTRLYRRAFGLTDREAELAALLRAGHSADSAAACLNVSIATVRTHMRRLFEKTGTTGQSALLQLLEWIG